MTEVTRILRRSDPDRLMREALGLAAVCVPILVGLFLPGTG
jgi:hypothetical protein